jgi:hypothetical protein
MLSHLIKVCLMVDKYDYLLSLFMITIGVIIYYAAISIPKIVDIEVAILIILLLSFIYFAKFQWINSFINSFYIIGSHIYYSSSFDFTIISPILWVFIPLSVILILFFSDRGFKNTVVLVSAVSVIYLWYSGYNNQIKTNLLNLSIIFSVSIGLNIFIKITNRMKKDGISDLVSLKNVAIYLIIFCVIISIIVKLTPKDFDGKITSQMRSNLKNIFSRSIGLKVIKDRYDLSFSGYTNNLKKLGGPIALNKDVVFKVKSEGAYYLKGTVKEFYDGYSWKTLKSEYTFLRSSDNVKMDDITNYIKEVNEMAIYPVNMRTSTMFVPEYTFNVNTNKDKQYYDSYLTYSNDKIVTAPYKIKFASINGDVDLFENVNINKNEIPMQSQTLYDDNNFDNKEYSDYLQLPTNISLQIYELVYDITKDCKTKLEKVQKLEEYLKNTFPYSLNVSIVPDGHEFIDYFINTEKKGYCIYYATAMTIFCRICGIPARYVEGFKMPNDKSSDGYYLVTNDNAHAWTEILLIPKTGLWSIVDSTPGEQNISKISGFTITTPKQAVDVNTINKNNNTSKDDSTYSKNNAGSPNKNAKIIIMLNKYIMIFFVVLGTLTVIFTSFIFLLIYKKRRVIRAKSIIPLYAYIMLRLEGVGIGKKDNIGDLEYVEKINDHELQPILKELVFAYYDEVYGNKHNYHFNKKHYYKFIEKYINKFKTNRKVKFSILFQKVSILIIIPISKYKTL